MFLEPKKDILSTLLSASESSRQKWNWSSRRASRRSRDYYRRSSSKIRTGSMRTSRSSTVVAELLTTFAGHSWASVLSFHPEFASGTLLVLGTLHIVDEILIVLIETIVDLVFGTSHTNVILTSAVQAIMLGTGRAAIVIQMLIKFVYRWASGSWAPSCAGSVSLNEFIERKLLELLLQVSINEAVDISNIEVFRAALHRARNFHFIRFYFWFQVCVDAFRVEDMSTLK